MLGDKRRKQIYRKIGSCDWILCLSLLQGENSTIYLVGYESFHPFLDADLCLHSERDNYQTGGR